MQIMQFLLCKIGYHHHTLNTAHAQLSLAAADRNAIIAVTFLNATELNSIAN